MAEYKENCGFRKINCCTFKPEHCRAKPDETDDTFCELYDIEFSSKSVKTEMKRVESVLKDLMNDTMDINKIKTVHELEKSDKNHEMVVAWKKKMQRVNDLKIGVDYLKKAYRHLKWSRR